MAAEGAGLLPAAEGGRCPGRRCRSWCAVALAAGGAALLLWPPAPASPAATAVSSPWAPFRLPRPLGQAAPLSARPWPARAMGRPRPRGVLHANDGSDGGDGPPQESSNFLSQLSKRVQSFTSAFSQPLKWPYEMPLQTLHLPKEDFIGGDYYLVPLSLGEDSEPLDFIVESGLAGSVVTPTTVKRLNLQPLSPADLKEIGGMPNTEQPRIRQDLIVVRDININGTVSVMSTVMAEVDFYQAKVAQRLGRQVAGMLGMDFLSQFDTDFDHKEAVLRLWPHTEGLKQWLKAPGAVALQGVTLPGNLLGIKVFLSVPEDWVPDPSSIPTSSTTVQYSSAAGPSAASAAAEIPTAGSLDPTTVPPAPPEPLGPAGIGDGVQEPPQPGPSKDATDAGGPSEQPNDANSNRAAGELPRLDRLLDSILESLPASVDDTAEPLVPALAAEEPKVGRPRPPPEPATPQVVTRAGKAIASIDTLFAADASVGTASGAAASPAPGRVRMRPYQSHPMPGIVALGVPYTIINWEAAGGLGIRKGDPRIQACPFVATTSQDGKSQQLPLIRARVTMCTFTAGTMMKAIPKQYAWRLEGLPINDGDDCVPFTEDILVAIGDDQFDSLLSIFPFGKYSGPVAMIGQDVLQQKRLRLSARRRVLVFDAEADLRGRVGPSPSPTSRASWFESIFKR